MEENMKIIRTKSNQSAFAGDVYEFFNGRNHRSLLPWTNPN